ncbi:hypothetical protein RZE82_04320 [Mollicutes bacterium LVI A0039]|nr:hypothetical protein RZE82_04320 [Mollicutes bacterium LVI A0039]
MKEEIQSAGNFVFDLIITNLVIILVSVVSLGTLAFSIGSILTNELDKNYFNQDDSGSIVNGLKMLKDNFIDILTNNIFHLIFVGILLLISISLKDTLQIVSIALNSFLIMFEISFWIIYLNYEYTTTHKYMLAFNMAIRSLLLGVIGYIVLLVIVLTFFNGAYYYLFFIPAGYILVLMIIQKKIISKYINKLQGA